MIISVTPEEYMQAIKEYIKKSIGAEKIEIINGEVFYELMLFKISGLIKKD